MGSLGRGQLGVSEDQEKTKIREIVGSKSWNRGENIQSSELTEKLGKKFNWDIFRSSFVREFSERILGKVLPRLDVIGRE